LELLDADSQALLSMLAASQPPEAPPDRKAPNVTGVIFDPKEVRKAATTVRT